MPSQEQEEKLGSPEQHDYPPASRAETLTDGMLDTTLTDLSASYLSTLFQTNSSRACVESLATLKRYTQELEKTYAPREIPFSSCADGPIIDIPKAEQRGDLVYIPRIRNAKAFIVSDSEGDEELIQAIFRKERILERLVQNNPNDQVFFISLGDMVDRAGLRASHTLEFLLNLKFDRGFHDKIHLLVGNHELSPHIQMSDQQGGFFREVVDFRSSYSIFGDIPEGLDEEISTWFESTFSSALPKDAAPIRVAVWREFNRIFTHSPKTIVTANGLVLCHAAPTHSGAFSFLQNSSKWPQPSFKQAIEWLTDIPFNLERYTDEEKEVLASMHEATIQDITWGDWSPDVAGTAPNTLRGQGILYDLKTLEQYLDCLGARVMIRGHQKNPPRGAAVRTPNVWGAGDSLLTINSLVGSSHFIQDDNGFKEVAQTKRGYLEVGLGSPINSINDVIVHEL